MLLHINVVGGYGNALKYTAIKTQIQSITYLFYMHVDIKNTEKFGHFNYTKPQRATYHFVDLRQLPAVVFSFVISCY